MSAALRCAGEVGVKFSPRRAALIIIMESEGRDKSFAGKSGRRWTPTGNLIGLRLGMYLVNLIKIRITVYRNLITHQRRQSCPSSPPRSLIHDFVSSLR